MKSRVKNSTLNAHVLYTFKFEELMQQIQWFVRSSASVLIFTLMFYTESRHIVRKERGDKILIIHVL